jgi:hypothetical protein
VAVERIAAGLAWAELRGRDRGLRGSSGAWLAVWVLAVSYRHIKKWAAADPVVIREKLEPGQQLVITHFAEDAAPPPLPKRSRRARRKSS